jgi:pentatricopeptide repeat protein
VMRSVSFAPSAFLLVLWWSAALGLVVRPPQVRSEKIISLSQQHRPDWKAAGALIREAHDSGEIVGTLEYRLAIKACGTSGRWREAMELLALFENGLAAPHSRISKHKSAIVFTQAMQVCGRAKRWEEALDMLDRMDALEIAADTRAYNAVLSACARAQQVNAMRDGLRRMTAARVRVDTHTFSIIMGGFARAGMPKQALKVFNHMGHSGVPAPDAVCYNVAINACARSGDWRGALRLLRRMRSCTSSVSPSAAAGNGDGDGDARRHPCSPSISSVSGAMAACTNGQRHGLALALFARLEDVYGLLPDTVACSTAIAAYSRTGDYRSALRLFHRMRRIPDARRDVVAYNTMLHACATAERRALGARHADRLRSLMRAEGVRADDVTFSVLLQSLWHRPAGVEVLDEAMVRRDGAFARCLQLRKGKDGLTEWTLDLHELSPGASVAMTLWCLSKVARRVASGASLPARVRLITGWGKSDGTGYQSLGRRRGAVRAAVLQALRACDVPIMRDHRQGDPSDKGPAPAALKGKAQSAVTPRRSGNPGLVALDCALLSDWSRSAISRGLVRGYFSSKASEDRLIIELGSDRVQLIERASGTGIAQKLSKT